VTAQDTGTAPFAPWLALPAGFAFPDIVFTVDAERQARDHRMLDIGDDLFGRALNAGVLTDVISRSVHAANLPIDGRVLLEMEVVQRAELRLDQKLVSRGRIDSLVPAARGHRLSCSYDIQDEGEPPGPGQVRLRSTLLLLDADTPRSPSKPKAAADVRDGFTRLAACTMTPDKVKAYCAEIGNLIHLDEAYAQARGYRAPVAPRLLDLTLIVAALKKRHGRSSSPFAFSTTLHVRRPLFWDEVLELWLKEAPGALDFRLVTAEGRLTSEATATL